MSENTPVFSIEKLYVKDLSIEVPNAPQIFLEQASPEISVELNTQAHGVGPGVFNVVLTVTVSAKLAGNGEGESSEKTMFLVEVGQGGVFRLENIPEDNLEPLLAIACPNVLFPYAREAISDAVSRAGFMPILLQPVNFEAMYMARQQAQQEQASNTAQ